MKNKMLVFAIALSLLFSVMLAAVGGSVGEEIGITESEAIEVYDWHDLDGIRDDLDRDYILMSDLDEDSDGYDELVDTENGWEPIGEYGEEEDVEFNGTFNGNGHEIRKLIIDRPDEDYVGLFGASKEEIKNLGIIDADVNGKNVVGGLVGQNDGKIEHSYAIGEVIGNEYIGGLVGYNWEYGKVVNSYSRGDVNGEDYVGGLIGVNWNEIDNSYSTAAINGGWFLGGLSGYNRGTIKNSYATGLVSGDRDLGGLVGVNWLGTIKNSYATGDVSDGLLAGGLVGYNDGGTVENSYATGDVSGNSPIGGLVGTNAGTIDKSYSTGEVRRGVFVYNNGGLVGLNDDGTVSDSYWDTDTSGLDESDGGTGLTTDEMIGEEALNNMEGFDFEEIWETVEENHEDADENGYPILQELSREEQLEYVYPADPAEDDGIPGFTSTLLLLGVIFAVAIYSKKKRS